jgi:hypothetical protein
LIRKAQQRAFPDRLAGRPYEPDDVVPAPVPVVAAPEPPTPAKKRGRPRKHPSNAVRQAQYRKRKQEPERLALMKKILKRIKGNESELAGLSIRQLRYYARWIQG